MMRYVIYPKIKNIFATHKKQIIKKLFPYLIIAVFALLTFGSCKKSSSSTCTCKSKGVSGQDTTGSYTKVDTGYVSLTAECDTTNILLKAVYGPNYGCHM